MFRFQCRTACWCFSLALAFIAGGTDLLRAGDKEDLYAAFENAGELEAKADFPAAAAQYERALALAPRVFGPNAKDTAVILNNLANLYSDMGEYAKTEPLYQRCLKIEEAALGPNHPVVARRLNNLATLYYTTGQFAKAEPLYQRGLKIREDKLGPDHPDVAAGHNNLAWLYQSQGQSDKAASECDRMRRIVRRHVAELLPVLSEGEQLAFIERSDEARFHGALSLGRLLQDDAALAEQSAGWLVNGKAVVLESLAERALLARDSADPALADKIQKLLALRTELAGLSLAIPKPGQEADHRRKLAELSDREQVLERQVNRAAGRPAQDNPWISWPQCAARWRPTPFWLT